MAEKTYNITLTASHQHLTAEYLPLAAESVQYLTAKVICETEDWTGREIKAMFGQGCTVHEVSVIDGEITAKQQLNLTAGDWCVWLVGNSARDGEVIPRITTNVAHISVAPTGGTEGNPFPVMPPTVEEQLRADMGNLADLTTKDNSNLVAAINETAGSGSKDAVKYTPQKLTDEQQAQARTNIGAGQPLYVVNVTMHYDEQGGEVYTADKTSAEIEAAYQAGCEIVCRMDVAVSGMGHVPVQIPLKSRRGRQIFMFALDQVVQIGANNGSSIIESVIVTIADDGTNAGYKITDMYTKLASGIPKSDLAGDVQTSLAKADAAISLGLTSATPGQIIKVKTVQGGKPTKWEAVDMPGGGEEWEKIKEITIAEDAEESNALTINADENGNAFRLKKARLCAKFPAYTGASAIPDFSFAMINGKTTGSIAPLAYTSVWPKIQTNEITGTIYNVDVSGAQQTEHVQRNGNASWSNDTSREYITYGSATDIYRTVYGDTLWAKPITSIGGTGMLIYPGCHFVLYGVRE